MYRHLVHKKEAHEDSIWRVSWAGKTNLIVSGSVDECVKVWDPENMDKPKHSFQDHEFAVTGLDTSPDGTTAVTSSMDGLLRAYNIVEGSQLKKIDAGSEGAWTVAFHPNGDLVAAGTKRGGFKFWSLEQAGPLGTSPKACAGVYKDRDSTFTMSVAVRMDGRAVVCGDDTGKLFLFDVEINAKAGAEEEEKKSSESGPAGSSPSASQCVRKFGGHVKPVRSVGFHPEGSLFATGCDDHYIHLYDSREGHQVAALEGHRSWVHCVQFSANGTTLASSSADNKVKLWDTRKPFECMHTFDNVHVDQVWSLSFNVDGTKLCSASDDGSLALYDCPETPPVRAGY